MSLRPTYDIPEPEEEAALFGVPGPDWLTQPPDTSTATQEVSFIETAGYDDHQEKADELASQYAAEFFNTLSLTAEQQAAVEDFIQDLLKGKD